MVYLKKISTMMKKLLLLSLLVSAVLRAEASAPDLDIECGPWIQNVSEESVTILWTTNRKALSWVEFDADNGNTWYQESHPAYYETVSGRRYYGTFHCVRISGLKKGTKYRYRILGKAIADDSNPYATSYGAERAISSVKTVKTYDFSAPSCRFSMVNDIHFDDERYAKLLGGMEKQKTDFVVLNGDIVSFSNSRDTLIKHTFAPIADIAANYPIVFARGNHEGRGCEWFELIKAFPSTTGEFYYSFRQGPVAFLILDGGEDKPDSDPEYSGQADYEQYRIRQLEWLKKAVTEPEFASAPKKVCIMHIPAIADKDAWATQLWIKENFTPILNAAGVDLMLSAHYHSYILAQPKEYGNDFPILVNSSHERLDFEATASKISVKIYAEDGKMTRDLSF